MGAAITALLEHDPRDEADAWKPSPSEQPAHEPAAAGCRVLLVEDEHIVRSWIARLLEEAGHFVRVAVNGGEALRLAFEDPIGFDLLITDVRMPGVDGWELGRRLTERWPGLPILYISGYDLQPSGRQSGSFLRKPFDPELLLARVAELLEDR